MTGNEQMDNLASFPSIEELESLLREGETSGEPLEMTASEWNKLHREVEANREPHSKAS